MILANHVPKRAESQKSLKVGLPDPDFFKKRRFWAEVASNYYIRFQKTKFHSMKKAILLIAIAFTTVMAVQAQGGGGGFQRRTPEERLKQAKEKMTDLKLDKDQTTKTDSVLLDSYKAQDKMFEEMRGAGGPPDRDQMREKMQKLAGERDDKLKKIFTEDQFKKWKDEIEPSLRPQRGGGNRGGGGNN